MDQANIAPIITAAAVLVSALTALIIALRQSPKLDTLNAKADGTLSHLQAKADLATEQRATAAELEARPPLPPPITIPKT